MKHPMERDTLRVRRRSAQCSIELTPRRRREHDRVLAQADAALAREERDPLAEYEAKLRERARLEAQLATIERHIRRKRFASSALRWLLALLALLLLVWLILAVEARPVCNARCELQERNYERTHTTYEQLGAEE